MHTAPYFAAFGLLTVLHSLRVMQVRSQHQVAFGDGGNDLLMRRIRVFGNFVEYVPMGLILLIALEILQAPTWYMHLAGLTLLLGRILHSMALGSDTGVGPLRGIGMVLTYLSLVVSSFGVLIWTFLEPSV